MKAIRKHPGKFPEVIDIENDVDAICTELDGHMEAVTVVQDPVIPRDEEGRIKWSLCPVCGGAILRPTNNAAGN